MKLYLVWTLYHWMGMNVLLMYCPRGLIRNGLFGGKGLLVVDWYLSLTITLAGLDIVIERYLSQEVLFLWSFLWPLLRLTTTITTSPIISPLHTCEESSRVHRFVEVLHPKICSRWEVEIRPHRTAPSLTFEYQHQREFVTLIYEAVHLLVVLICWIKLLPWPKRINISSGG